MSLCCICNDIVIIFKYPDDPNVTLVYETLVPEMKSVVTTDKYMALQDSVTV